MAVEVAETFPLDSAGTALVLLHVALADGDRARLTAPSGEPLLGEGAGASASAPWRDLHRLATRGGEVVGSAGGRLVGHPATPSVEPPPRPSARPAVRPSPGDQSHTSVILDETTILKLYRRLSDGPNPEVELLSALASGTHPAPVPALTGWVEIDPGDGGPATAVAVVQAFIPDAEDAFETVANDVAAWLSGTVEDPPATTLAAAVGRATAGLHAALAAVEAPGFVPTPSTTGERRRDLEGARAALDRALTAVGSVDPVLAARLTGLAPKIRAGLMPLGDPGTIEVRQRIHGDLHLGQILATPRGVVLVDFEGDPMREVAERGRPASPLRDLAAFLRSLDHALRSGIRRAGAMRGAPPTPRGVASAEAWLADARAAFLGAYGQPVVPALLRAHELEKAMLEFTYAATFLPSWLYAPTGALVTLLPEARG